LRLVLNDIIKARNTGSGDSKSSGPSGASGKDVHYIPKSKYPKRPTGATGETDHSWIVPKGGSGNKSGPKKDDNTTPTTSPKDSVSQARQDVNQSDSPTPEEHHKLSELAAQAGNTKLADKHKKLAQTPKLLESDPNTESKTGKKAEPPKIPETDSDKAQNLIHNAKASEAKKKAREILNKVPSTHKPALKQIIEALEDHETRPHIPSAQEKKELRELTQAVSSMSKPVESKDKETKKLFDSKIKEKQKETKEKQKLVLRESKNKDKAQEKIKQQEEKRAAKETETKKKEEKRLILREEKTKDRDQKESEKIAKKKEAASNKLKEKLARDVQKPRSAEEDAQLVQHSVEAKELVTKLDEAIAMNQENPELVKVLEAHRRVANNHAQMSRLPKKEDVKALKEAKTVMSNQEKATQKQEKEVQQAAKNGQNVSTTTTPKKPSMNAYNTGRKAGENVAHQGVADDGGAEVTGQAVGGVGRGVASAGHHLLSPDEEKKVIRKEEPKQSSLGKSLGYYTFNKAMGNDSDIERNENTFDDGKPTGLTSDLEDSEMSEITKSISKVIQKTNDLEQQFLNEYGYRDKSVIKGIKASKYSKWLCNKVSNSFEDIRKSL
jgi:hypothetical protein